MIVMITVNNNNRLVLLIAVWMIVVVSPWAHYFFKERGFIPQTLLEGLALAGIAWVVSSALGLVLSKETARLWSVWMFIIYFFWNFYVVCFNIAPFFTVSVEWLSNHYHIPIDNLRNMTLLLLIIHILWPLMVVMYLTNPSVKSLFNPMAEVHP